jgi:hypothetical protein
MMSGTDIDSEETLELRTAAIAVWHYWRIAGTSGAESRAAMLETKAEESRRMERFRVELHRIVGERDDINLSINGGCVEAEVEDLRFIALEFAVPKTGKPLTLVTLLGRCSSCGMEVMSEPFYNLAGLGERLVRFKPNHRHMCCER